MVNCLSINMPQQFNKERLFFSKNGTAGYPHAKEWIWIYTSHCLQNELKMDRGPKCKHLRLFFLGEKIGISVHDYELGSGFLDMATKTQAKI